VFTRGAVDPPEEYIEYKLCHEVYHCTPAELDEQDSFTVNLHWAFYVEELEEQNRRAGKGRA
jgi:hypothetical protein